MREKDYNEIVRLETEIERLLLENYQLKYKIELLEEELQKLKNGRNDI